MNLEKATSLSLKVCIAIGITLTIIGLLISESEYGDRIIWVGLLVLIISPLIGVVVTYVHLIKEKDRFWVKVATVLICIISVGLIITLLL